MRSPLPLTLVALILPVILPFAGAADVRQFGAKGDGAADDTSAIQRALEGGVAAFPKGTYRITTTITVDLDKTGPASLSGDGTARIVMAGSGPAFRFVGTHAGSADPKTLKPGTWERQRSPRVSGIEFTGEHAEADAIEAKGTIQLTITGCVIHKVRHGIHLVERNRNVLISDCHIYENKGCGVFLDQVNLHQTNIIGSHISYNAGGGVVVRGGEVRNLHIGTCDIESNMAPNAPETANILIDCRGGSTDEVAITGCTIQHNSKSPGSANIRYIGAGITSSRNAAPTQEGHLTITGNIFSDVMINVHLQDVRGATISGNTFWEGFEHDLLMERCHAVVVGPNDFDRNPRYVVNGNWGKERNGIVLRECEDTKLDGLLVKGVWQKQAAILLEKCKRTTVQNCSVFDNDGTGLLLRDCERCAVSGCVIRDDRPEKKSEPSLQVEGGKDNWITNNWLAGGAEGLTESEMKANRQ
jgi:parallel beta-helix repeat protein